MADDPRNGTCKAAGQRTLCPAFFCGGDEPKSGLARDLGDRIQSRNVPFGTSGDLRKIRADAVFFLPRRGNPSIISFLTVKGK